MKYVFRLIFLLPAICINSCHPAKQSSLEKVKLHKPDLPVRVLFKNSNPEFEQDILNELKEQEIQTLSEKEALALTVKNFDAALHSIKDIKSISSKSEMESAMRAGLKPTFYIMSIYPEFQNERGSIKQIKYYIIKLSNQQPPSSQPPYSQYIPIDSSASNETKIQAFTQFLFQSKVFR